MSPPDLGKILAQAQQMQARVAEMRQELARRRFEGSSGGGMVSAVVSGDSRVLEIRIEPSFFEGGDREMLQDLSAAAVNAALANAQRGVQEELQKLTGAAGLPASLFGGSSG